MKRIGFSIVLMLLLAGLSFAQGVLPVTFQVDMSIQKQLNKFSPDTQIVVIRGSFIDEANPTLQDWQGNLFELSPSQSNPDVYTLDVNLPDSLVGTSFEFKYVIDGLSARGNTTTQGGAWEGISNRTFTLQAGGQVLDKVFFNDQSQIGGNVNVTFKVNMKVMQELGLFNPATQVVAVRGSFNDWGNSQPEDSLADGDGDLTYDGKVDVGNGSSVAYKFVVRTGSTVTWEDNISDRQLTLTGSDQELDPVEWNNGVKLRVVMNVAFRKGLFNPANHFVSVAGGFNDWLGTGSGITNGDSATARKFELTDANNDTVYEANVPIGTSTVLYKFTINNKSNGKIAAWENDPNRTIDPTGMTLGAPTHKNELWDRDEGGLIKTGTVLFQVDISPLRDNGIFDETQGDTLQLRGEFNGWSDSDPSNSIMRQSFLNPNIYELPITLTDVIGKKLNYKYYIKFNFNRSTWAGIPNPSSDWGYEEPGSTGGGNRVLEFDGQAQRILDPVPYKDVYDFIPAGKQVTYNFIADMRCYLRDAANNGADKSTDTLRLNVQDIVWHIFNGTRQYQDAVNLRGVTPFDFSDADGDSIYTLALTTKGLNQNWVQYKLNWQGNEELAPGFEYGRRRVRYVRPDAQGNYADSYKMGVDYFSTVTDPLPIETPTSGVIQDEAPCSVTPVTSVAQTQAGVPKEYFLSQNYPNPFNPSTTIEYAVRNHGRVVITLYNSLGQKVADLVDQMQVPGTYKLTVDLSEFDRTASGVYFYQIKAGDFTFTRRMLFVK